MKILFATPVADRPTLAWWAATHSLRNYLGAEESVNFFTPMGSSDLARQRNEAAHFARINGFDVVLFFDDDQGADGDALLMLCRLAAKLDAPVGAAVAIKTTPPRWNVQLLDGDSFQMSGAWEEIHRVKFVGTGALAIPVTVFDKLDAAARVVEYPGLPPIPGFFCPGFRDNNPYLEDRGFGWLCHDNGIPMYIDRAVKVEHFGLRAW